MVAKEEAISLRRGRVAEMIAKGFNQSQIAKEVRASEATISRDVEELRSQAIKNVESHIENLPHAWETAKLALEGLIRKANEILASDELDAGGQLDVIKTLADLTLKRLDIHSSPAVMKKSIDHIQKLKSQIEALKKDQGSPWAFRYEVEQEAGKAPKVTRRPVKKKPVLSDPIV